METTKQTTNTAPDYIVYQVKEGDKKPIWTPIGAAWLHKDFKGMNIQLSSVPLHGRIQVRLKDKAKPKQ